MGKDYLKKDQLMTRATVGAVGILLISIISISFDNSSILWGWSLVPNIINSICK